MQTLKHSDAEARPIELSLGHFRWEYHDLRAKRHTWASFYLEPLLSNSIIHRN